MAPIVPPDKCQGIKTKIVNAISTLLRPTDSERPLDRAVLWFLCRAVQRAAARRRYFVILMNTLSASTRTCSPGRITSGLVRGVFSGARCRD